MRTLKLLATLALVGAAFAAETEMAADEPLTAPAPVTLGRPALAVLPFADKSPEAGMVVPPVPGAAFDLEAPMPWLGDGIPGVLEFTLERAAAVNLVARKDFASALKRRKDLELALDTPADVLADVGTREGVTHFVAGSFNKTKKDVVFTVEVRKVSGEVVAAKDFSCQVDKLFPAATEAAKFVAVSAGAGDAAGLIPREPTSSLEALMWFGRGAGRVYTGERITFFSRATDKDPKFAEAFLALAEAFRLEKNLEEAKATYEMARALADYYPSAPVGLALVARKLEPDNKEGALALCNEAFSLDPNYAPAYDCIGGIYAGAGDYEKARAAYEKYTQIWPSSKDGFYGLGTMLFYIGKPSPQWKTILGDAIAAYDKSLAIDPDFAACHYNIASIYKIFENVDKASYHFRRYIELEPNAPNRKDIEDTLAEWEKKKAGGK